MLLIPGNIGGNVVCFTDANSNDDILEAPLWLDHFHKIHLMLKTMKWLFFSLLLSRPMVSNGL